MKVLRHILFLSSLLFIIQNNLWADGKKAQKRHSFWAYVKKTQRRHSSVSLSSRESMPQLKNFLIDLIELNKIGHNPYVEKSFRDEVNKFLQETCIPYLYKDKNLSCDPRTIFSQISHIFVNYGYCLHTPS